MAKVTVQLPKELNEQIVKLGNNTDRIVQKCLEAAAVPVKKAVLEKYDATVGRPLIVRKGGRIYNYGMRSTGELRRSIGISPAKLNRKGDYDIKIGIADGKESKTGISYGYLAAIIERGVPARRQPPRPFIKPAEKASKAASMAAFEKTFDEEVSKL